MSNNGLLSLNTKQDIQPEKIFDLKEKLGEGSYGSVYKAVHKASNSLVAIKKVPLDSDLQVDCTPYIMSNIITYRYIINIKNS